MHSPEQTRGQITQSLLEWRAGNEQALDRLASDLYQELRRLAGAILSGHSNHQTIQPTVLVHELYFQLPNIQAIDWQGRVHFLNVAAKMMRNILVDHVRSRNAAKRGGGNVGHLTIDPPSDDPWLTVDVLQVHEALEKLAVRYPRQANVVEPAVFWRAHRGRDGGSVERNGNRIVAANGAEGLDVCAGVARECDWEMSGENEPARWREKSSENVVVSSDPSANERTRSESSRVLVSAGAGTGASNA